MSDLDDLLVLLRAFANAEHDDVSVCDDAADAIKELRAENERLAKEVNHWREARRTALLAGDVLKAENERLRADKDRLDWLDGTALSVDLVADPDGLVQVWYNTDPPMVSAAKGVRAAIDAAMKASGSPESP